MQLKTAGDLRGFLAGVLVGIKEGTVDANQANAISKVAAQINHSLAAEIQARMHLKELGGSEAGAMVIATDPDATPPELVQVQPQVPEEPKADPIAPDKVPPVRPIRLEDATANYAKNRVGADKIWCDQCDLNVTLSQAISCKSRHCKAKDAA